MAKPQMIKLGQHEYLVLPQPIGYLMNELGPELQAVLEAEVDGVDGVRVLGSKAYDVLRVFIPDLMPRHEFLGFPTEEAMRAKEYPGREVDPGPTAPQVKAAFEAVKKANGGEVLDGLKAVLAMLGPELRQRVSAFLVTLITQSEKFREIASTLPTSAPSPTSPSTSGESASTSSIEPTPIPPQPASAG